MCETVWGVRHGGFMGGKKSSGINPLLGQSRSFLCEIYPFQQSKTSSQINWEFEEKKTTQLMIKKFTYKNSYKDKRKKIQIQVVFNVK